MTTTGSWPAPAARADESNHGALRPAAGLPEVTELAHRIGTAGVLVHPLSWHRIRPGVPGLVLGYAAHPPDRLQDAAHGAVQIRPLGQSGTDRRILALRRL